MFINVILPHCFYLYFVSECCSCTLHVSRQPTRARLRQWGKEKYFNVKRKICSIILAQQPTSIARKGRKIDLISFCGWEATEQQQPPSCCWHEYKWIESFWNHQKWSECCNQPRRVTQCCDHRQVLEQCPAWQSRVTCHDARHDPDLLGVQPSHRGPVHHEGGRQHPPRTLSQVCHQPRQECLLNIEVCHISSSTLALQCTVLSRIFLHDHKCWRVRQVLTTAVV